MKTLGKQVHASHFGGRGRAAAGGFDIEGKLIDPIRRGKLKGCQVERSQDQSAKAEVPDLTRLGKMLNWIGPTFDFSGLMDAASKVRPV
ncbi:MAG TPA: hypothetical protein VHW24_21725 [Bryobacteraceae bacterium]|nr:hypothetical protein [Bryobacteraceae bacterium]